MLWSRRDKGVTRLPPERKLLFEISVNDVDQFLGRDNPWIVPGRARVEHVFANVILDHLGDETVQSAPTGGGLLQHAGAFMIGLDRPFDGIDLATQSLEPIQQFGLFFCNVAHRPKILQGTKAPS